ARAPAPALTPLSLHDALPIWSLPRCASVHELYEVGQFDKRNVLVDMALGIEQRFAECSVAKTTTEAVHVFGLGIGVALRHPAHRSEEHTSELQSRFDLVCRLL